MSEQNPGSRLSRLLVNLRRWAPLIRQHKYLSVTVVVLLLLLLLHSVIGWSRTAGFSQQEGLVQADKYRATIRRDSWGVPHISGKRDRDVAFGAAYAQATDALPDVEYSLRLHKAQLGLHEGASGARLDWLVHLLRSQEIADEHWLKLDEKVRDLLTAYADGLNYYAAENPDEVDISLYPASGQDLMAAMHFQQAMFYGLGEIVGALASGKLPDTLVSASDTRGSNAIAISPARGWGATRLVINSHQPLTGPFSWYEMRLSSEEGWEMHGGTFPGSPFLYLGVNRHLGWGATVNKPGLVDLYQLQIHPEDSRRYRFDGVWWDMEVKEVRIPVKLFGNFFWTWTYELEYARAGPVFRIGEDTYAVHYAGAGEMRQAEQWYRMNKAENRQQWFDAMRMRALPSLNFVYADAEGNIDFLYNALLRKRPANLLAADILPGHTSEALNLELHPFDDLPQVRNPESGWIASTNQTPLSVTGGRDNPRPERYGADWKIDRNINNRSLRITELLSRAGPVDGQRLIDIKLDKSYSERFRHLHWRDSLLDGFEPNDRLLEDAQRELVLWDLQTDTANRQAAMGVCMVEASRAAEKADEIFELVHSMRQCAGTLQGSFGGLSPAWGDVLRLRRGEQSWPLAGGPDLLRAVHSVVEEDGTRTAVAGDGLTIIAEWNDGLKLNVIHQFGSSRIPGNPHYADQAALFAEEKFRPVFDYDQEIKGLEVFSQKIPY